MPQENDAAPTERSPGWPIYQDPVDRNLPVLQGSDDTDWYPATHSSKALWCCFAALHKLAYSLRGSSRGMNQRQIRQFVVHFAVPLDDFFICVRNLGKALSEESRLSESELAFVKDLSRRFDAAVVSRSGAIKRIRNKAGAHTDVKMWPDQFCELVADIEIEMVGGLLHGSLLALQKYAKLNCYSWTSRGYREGEFRLMACEPVVLNLSDNGEAKLLGFEFSESPKRHIQEMIVELVNLTEWMFPEGECPLIVNDK